MKEKGYEESLEQITDEIDLSIIHGTLMLNAGNYVSRNRVLNVDADNDYKATRAFY